MKIIQDYPPNIEEIQKAFDLANRDVVFTYGNIIYSPRGTSISKDLMVHEQVHERQQTKFLMSPKRWWKKYLKDPKFRLNQEVEAYRAQFQYIKKDSINWKLINRFLFKISTDLASPIYGNLVTQYEAADLIASK